MNQVPMELIKVKETAGDKKPRGTMQVMRIEVVRIL